VHFHRSGGILGAEILLDFLCQVRQELDRDRLERG
jgi:hypothetical protein